MDMNTFTIDSSEVVKRFMHACPVLSVAYSPNGTHIVCPQFFIPTVNL